MKRVALMTVALALSAIVVANLQAQPPGRGEGRRPGAAGQPGAGARFGAAGGVEALEARVGRLDLSEQQTAEIKALVDARRTKLTELQEKAAATEAQRAAMRAAFADRPEDESQEDRQARIQAAVNWTPEQQEARTALRTEMQELTAEIAAKLTPEQRARLQRAGAAGPGARPAGERGEGGRQRGEGGRQRGEGPRGERGARPPRA